MRFGCGLLFGFFVFQLGLSNAYGLSDGLSLDQRWQLEQKSSMSGLQGSTLMTLQDRHILFIAGIMNGVAYLPWISSYFGTNIEVVQEEFRTGASYFGPWSSVPTTENAEDIYEEILRVHEEVKKPLILVAHSKGAAETLLAILNHPLLMLGSDDRVVDRVVLIQGSIGGTLLATQEDRGWLMKAFSYFLDAGVRSLTREQAHKNFEEAFEAFKTRLLRNLWFLGKKKVLKSQKEISSRIFYVRSAFGSLPLSRGVKATLGICGRASPQYCEPLGSHSDGLLEVEDQMFTPKTGGPFGVDLGILRADHIELVVSGYFSRSTGDSRRAFTRALLEQIFQY